MAFRIITTDKRNKDWIISNYSWFERNDFPCLFLFDAVYLAIKDGEQLLSVEIIKV
jgi:hypothetical protein